MRAPFHPMLACPRQAVRPMIKPGTARGGNLMTGLTPRQFLFLDIDGGLAQCPRHSTGGPTNRMKSLRVYAHGT
jgi:hypothetical protein